MRGRAADQHCLASIRCPKRDPSHGANAAAQPILAWPMPAASRSLMALSVANGTLGRPAGLPLLVRPVAFTRASPCRSRVTIIPRSTRQTLRLPEEHTARRRCRVDSLLMQHQRNPGPLELAQRVQQVGE
jgi:hypothetical protein